MRSILSIVVFGLLAGRVLAAPPDASSLFPAGGQVGQTVNVMIAGNTKPWPVQIWTDDKGLAVEADKKEGQLIVTIGKDAEPGLHWLRFHNADGASAPRPFVVGTLSEVADQEPNNELAKAQQLPSGPVTINGKLKDAGDIDTFLVELQQGQTIVADIDAERPFGSPVDMVLQLVDPQGFVLAQNNDDVGLDPRIEFKAAHSGKHYLRLFGYSSTPSTAVTMGGADTFIYRLTVTTGALVDYAYPLSVQRGASRDVDLCGWQITDAIRKTKVNAATDASLLKVFNPLAGGAAEVRVVDRPVAVEREPNDREHPQVVTLPIVLSGRCSEPGDVDCYAFVAKKGQRLVAKAEARSLGFVTDPILMVLNDQGTVLQTVDDAGQQRDCELGFGIPADGRYLVAIRDLYLAGSPRHVYQLTLRIDEPDFEVTVPATEYVVAKGKSIEIPLTIDRRPGFAEEIAFDVKGLPKDAKIDAPKSVAKGETAKSVKLKVTAGEMPSGGPIQVIAQSQGEKKLTRTIGATLTNHVVPWTQIWLTVTK